MTKLFHAFVLPVAALALAGCEQAAEAPEVEPVEPTEDVVLEETLDICDENGNRYASNEEAEAAGLEPAQYGATYCQYFEGETAGMHPTWDADGDGINDCEDDGSCDHTVDYSQPRPETE
ncbi:hypothetical protein [Aurantiacibacter sp. D1-12]|uniref:hypothetical protein n=1 Tax=Aurantiacibacter sp. D1-12 TaxID=2993658 RepID=UPI00237D2BA4|nr:hypothetical protein [Aurantiacibacter sp. D1-12]MDE1467211.1 hypothetical protein [Aurantiacibacter sp. D1-12]